MSSGQNSWQDGRRAWERLNGWHQDVPSATPGHPDNGQSALAALADVGMVRRLLDQAELVAVQAARSHGKSWAEIATKLGVTRQSAWERWRDLDDEVGAPAGGARPARLRRRRDFVRDARVRRRRDLVRDAIVPDVVGQPYQDGVDAVHAHGLVAVGPDPDGPPLAALGWPGGVVSRQEPSPGTPLTIGASVTLWIRRPGGGAGVREPRRPAPDPQHERAALQEPTEDTPSAEHTGAGSDRRGL